MRINTQKTGNLFFGTLARLLPWFFLSSVELSVKDWKDKVFQLSTLFHSHKPIKLNRWRFLMLLSESNYSQFHLLLSVDSN